MARTALPEWEPPAVRAHAARRGFTLIELLIVVLIVALVSAIALPTVISSWRERQAISAASLLQATLEQARAEAQATGVPRGLRLLPDESLGLVRLADGRIDPTAPLACNRWVALDVPGSYSEGKVSIFAGFAYAPAITGGLPALVLEQSPGRWEQSGAGWTWVLNAPTSWAWNIRVGDRVTLGAGSEYCVCGPMVVGPAGGNIEQFVNYGSPGTVPPITRTYIAPDGTQIQAQPEYLMLVNGRDDDGIAGPDSGWDGTDNDLDGVIDNAAEWEVETWGDAQSKGLADAAYSIRRRPAPASGSSRTVVMPGSTVVDLSTWAWVYPERSRLPVNEWTGAVDLLIGADGRLTYDLPWMVPSAINMTRTAAHFWIGDRTDVPQSPLPVEPVPPDQTAWLLPAAKEDTRLVSVTRSGRVVVSELDPANPAPAYLRAMRGAR